MTTDTTADPQFTLAEALDEHRWLRRFLGVWTWASDGASGTETGRALGDIWIAVDGDGERPGADGARDISQLTLGFDPKSKRFVGTWVGSMMAHQWVYDGELQGNTLTLTAEGPAFDGSARMQTYRDVHEFVADDHRILKASVKNDDGTWEQFMTTEYRRK